MSTWNIDVKGGADEKEKGEYLCVELRGKLD
jgi:hypothetical protein